MNALVEKQIATILDWPLPTGVHVEVRYNHDTGVICIAMKAGDLNDIMFIVAGQRVESFRDAMIERASILLARWTCELEKRKAQVADVYSTTEVTESTYRPWVITASKQLYKLERERSDIPTSILNHATMLLLTAECDDILPPSVTVTHDRNIRFNWNYKGQGASVEVRPRGVLYVTTWNETTVLSQLVYKSSQVDRFRSVIGWLFAQANAEFATPDYL